MNRQALNFRIVTRADERVATMLPGVAAAVVIGRFD